MKKKVLYPLVALFGLAVSIGPVSAHAHVESTEPRNGDTVKSSPAKIVVRFGNAVEPALSTINVTTDADKAVDLEPTELSDGETTLSAKPVSTLQPAIYHVRWKALSHDGHPVSGEFSFTVSK